MSDDRNPKTPAEVPLAPSVAEATAMLLANGATVVERRSGLATRGVRATFEARRVQVHGESHCTGADGFYRFAHETYQGTSTGDEELTGRFVLEIQAADNVTQGFLGLATGTVRIYDPATGRLKVLAEVSAIDSPSIDPPGVKVDGFVRGYVLRDPGASAEEATPRALFANFSVRLDTTAAFIGNLGADEPIAPQNTAVLQDAAAPSVPPGGPNEV